MKFIHAILSMQCVLLACGDSADVEMVDANASDVGTDVGESDAGTPDAGEDAGMPDAAMPDAAMPDSAMPPSDAGLADANPDAGDTCGEGDAPTVYLVGDSTTNSNTGWGDPFESYFDGVSVVNTARGGRSSRSFYEEGSFDPTREALEPGDYVTIQFGHNDGEVTEPGSAPDYEGSFRDYLERYIDETRAAGAIPILITPVSRMFFTAGGDHRRTHGEYAPAVRQVALDNDVVMLDLEELSHEVFDELGRAETLRLFSEDDDEDDRTHFPPEKAFRVTEMVVSLLAESASPLACYLSDDS